VGGLRWWLQLHCLILDGVVAARLGEREREEISRGVAAGEPPASIGRRLGRATSTITRELDRGARLGRGREDYRATRASIGLGPQRGGGGRGGWSSTCGYGHWWWPSCGGGGRRSRSRHG
jgi:hypothetical protein